MTLCAAYPQNSPPLNEGEKRTILLQLNELKGCRATVQAYEQFTVREQKIDADERTNAARALELERQATGLAQKEGAIYKQQAEFYRAAFESVTRGPSVWCKVKRVLTLGLARCR